MKAGIDRISFYTSRYSLDLKLLAEARGADWNKYSVGIGQEIMGVPPPDEDVVTMAASAAKPILDDVGTEGINLVLFATESGIDQSKSAGMFVHGLLGLPSRCRVVELKQACYSATPALRLAAMSVAANPGSKALVLASDIARYELGSPAEPTQGCGAIAMLVTAAPSILALDDACGIHAEDVMDFWRPNYREEAIVEGKASTRVYLNSLQHAWSHYKEQTGRTVGDFSRCCYHTPFTNMACKAHKTLLKAEGIDSGEEDFITRQVTESLAYNRQTGNTYTASLYACFACLLDNASEPLDGRLVSFYSYGSGCMGEFFSGTVVPGYRNALYTGQHHELLGSRVPLTVRQYEDIFNLTVPRDGWDYTFSQYRTGPFRLAGIGGHKRRYEASS
jgi:hydroxymethylglutaryl-CoA synthase